MFKTKDWTVYFTFIFNRNFYFILLAILFLMLH